MKEITKEQLLKIFNANEPLKGTIRYAEFRMQSEAKVNNHWIFTGWDVPNPSLPAYYKKTKTGEYIMQGDERYMLKENIKSLIF